MKHFEAFQRPPVSWKPFKNSFIYRYRKIDFTFVGVQPCLADFSIYGKGHALVLLNWVKDHALNFDTQNVVLKEYQGASR